MRHPGTHNSFNDRGVPSASNSRLEIPILEIPIGEIKNKERRSSEKKCARTYNPLIERGVPSAPKPRKREIVVDAAAHVFGRVHAVC